MRHDCAIVYCLEFSLHVGGMERKSMRGARPGPSGRLALCAIVAVAVATVAVAPAALMPMTVATAR